MSELTPKQAHQIWLQAAEKVKDRVIAPTLYRALELPVGIAVDGDEFILGFSNQDSPMAGHLRSAQHRAIIDQCVSEVLKKKVRVRIIEGTTPEDYEHYKELLKSRETHPGHHQRPERERARDHRGLGRGRRADHPHVCPASTCGSSRSSGRSSCGRRSEIINEAVEEMGYDENSDEIQKRALARVFEKFATVVEIPVDDARVRVLQAPQGGQALGSGC